jgi:hypothetical protein
VWEDAIECDLVVNAGRVILDFDRDFRFGFDFAGNFDFDLDVNRGEELVEL